MNKKLNEMAHNYLTIILNEYGDYFNKEQLTYLKELYGQDVVEIENDEKKYVNNIYECIDNKPLLTQEEKELEKKNLKIPLAHGARVYNDDKIHFYPFIVNGDDSEKLNACSNVLLHEILHYFIRPGSLKEAKIKGLTSYVTEGLVDMCNRDLISKYNLINNYSSEYGNNVMFVRNILSELNDSEKKSIVFNASVDDIVTLKYNNDNDLKESYTQYKNKETDLDKIINYVSKECIPQHYESGCRYLRNISSNMKCEKDVIDNIRNMIYSKYPDKYEMINSKIDEISNNDIDISKAR